MTELSDLVVDESELNKELLFEVLSDFIRIGKRDNSLIPQKAYHDLKSGKKIIVVLLALKAMKTLNMREDEKEGPTEISKLSGVKKGTVLPRVRQLEKKGLLLNEDGSYYIPNYNLSKAKEYVLNE